MQKVANFFFFLQHKCLICTQKKTCIYCYCYCWFVRSRVRVCVNTVSPKKRFAKANVSLTEFLVSNLGQKMKTLTSMSRQVIKTASSSQPGYPQKLLRCNLLLNFKSVYKLIVGVDAYK